MLTPREVFCLESERLLLRDWKNSDWQAAFEYASDPEVSKYMNWGPNTERETKAFITSAIMSISEKPRLTYELAVVLKEEGKIIGGTGMRLKPEESKAMIGYVFNRSYWGKGLATEAAQRLVRFGFEELNLHRIFATCDAENLGSAN